MSTMRKDGIRKKCKGLYNPLHFSLYTLQFMELSEPEFEDGLELVASGQFDAAVVVAHDLAGQGQADAGAFRLGGPFPSWLR